MKRYFLIVFVSIISTSILAQSNKESYSLIRVNGMANFVHKEHQTGRYEFKNGTIGFSIEAGGKSFLSSNNRLFLEGTASFFLSRMPFCKVTPRAIVTPRTAGTSGTSGKNLCLVAHHFQESGWGASVSMGYDFFINDKLSLDLMTGPIFRYTTHFHPEYYAGGDMRMGGGFHKMNFIWRLSAGLNVNRFCFSLGYNQSFLNRSKFREIRYVSGAIVVGVTYRFPLFSLSE